MYKKFYLILVVGLCSGLSLHAQEEIPLELDGLFVSSDAGIKELIICALDPMCTIIYDDDNPPYDDDNPPPPGYDDQALCERFPIICETQDDLPLEDSDSGPGDGDSLPPGGGSEPGDGDSEPGGGESEPGGEGAP